MVEIPALREIPPAPPYKKGDVLVVFGELFARGYANGIVDEAEKNGMTVVRSTVGRRDEKGELRALTAEEMASIPKPFINVALEAGFDMDKASDGLAPVDRLTGVKMAEWDQIKLDWNKIEESREIGEARFKKQVAAYMKELEQHIPKGANVIFAHTMAGGVPRAKIMMPTMNRIFKGEGERHLGSDKLQKSDLGKFAEMNFDEVTANTFRHLLEGSQALSKRIHADGGSVHYIAYSYHGTEVMIKDKYQWQTYTPYFQGWAKMRLENLVSDAHKTGVKTCVYNCPEILTNSTTIFAGVELSLYPLLQALQKEGATSAHVKTVLGKCRALLKDGHSFGEIKSYLDGYLDSDILRPYNESFKEWPMHNAQDEMDLMLQSSAHLIGMHKDEKQLMTAVLSEEIFKATGVCIFRDSWAPKQPVLWLGHDILAKVVAQFDDQIKD